MSIAASAENTMFKKEIENVKKEIENVKKEIENDAPIDTNKTQSQSSEEIESDDDMIIISIRETNENEPQTTETTKENQPLPLEEEEEKQKQPQITQTQTTEKEEEKAPPLPPTNEKKQKKGEEEEFFVQLKDEMESKKLFPLMSCNMVSAFGCAMQHVEYLDITNAERKAMATELVKCLAYLNNEHGARECFDYLFQNNMTDDIIKTIIDCTKDRYDINKYPHTNRNIVLSCVSLSKKVKKTTQPKFDLLEDLFEFNFKFNFCELKRFFKIKDGSKSV